MRAVLRVVEFEPRDMPSVDLTLPGEGSSGSEASTTATQVVRPNPPVGGEEAGLWYYHLERIGQLAQLLGDPSYRVREAAQREIQTILAVYWENYDALNMLRAELDRVLETTTDPEIRDRLGRIMTPAFRTHLEILYVQKYMPGL